MRVLVTGGAGYIGSHMVRLLLQQGFDVATFDNLAHGHREAVTGGELIQGDLLDPACLDTLFRSGDYDAVMHFASLIQVGESVQEPAVYFRNNIVGTLNLLDAMAAHRVRRFIFSSSAAIFGEPEYTPIDEAHPKRPISPYGYSKWAVEQMLADYDRAYGLRSVSLRYFNAAGADPDGGLGERHEPETHLIPLVLQAAAGRRPAVQVFGHDYPTPDGTCLRDYIHVVDLCRAHLDALRYLEHEGRSDAFNLGNSRGYSIREVIQSVERVTGRRVAVTEAPRRAGDPAVLVADSKRARDVLGWQPRFGDLDTIVDHAWRWEQSHFSEAGRHAAPHKTSGGIS